jgi:hypothetical protein
MALLAVWHEGNPVEKNNGYVVFKWYIFGSAGPVFVNVYGAQENDSEESISHAM